MRIERLDLGNAHTESERLLYFHSLPVRAAVRLSHGLPIKALDPVGTSFLLLVTTNRQKVTEIISGPPKSIRPGADYTIVSSRLSTLKRPVRSHRHGALMPLKRFRLTGFCPTSKLFFAASQKGFPIDAVKRRGAPAFGG
jgi:hypothetical protein